MKEHNVNQKRNHLGKTLGGILFNIAGAYLLFYPTTDYPYWITKIVGIIGLLFSYHIFYKEVKQ